MVDVDSNLVNSERITAIRCREITKAWENVVSAGSVDLLQYHSRGHVAIRAGLPRIRTRTPQWCLAVRHCGQHRKRSETYPCLELLIADRTGQLAIPRRASASDLALRSALERAATKSALLSENLWGSPRRHSASSNGRRWCHG